VTPRRALLGLSLLVLLCAGLFVAQAWQAASSLSDSRGRAAEVERLIRGGDFEAASAELDLLRSDTRAAARATDGWLWDLGARLPWVGEEVAAVQTSASVLDRITAENQPVVLRLTRMVTRGALRPREGRVDLAAVRRMQPLVERAAASINRQHRRLADVDTEHLGFPFRDVVGELVDRVDSAHAAATATATAFDLLPGMLGADEPRSYLLMVQNNAEVRSTGGIPGSLAVLHADRGRIRMGLQGSAGDFAAVLPEPVRLPREVLRLYGETVRTDLRDATLNPDFPQAARTAAAMLQARHGIRVDGVVSVDPVALAFLLQGTGPVKVHQAGRTGVLTHANAVSVLLNMSYQLLPDQAGQDEFFQRAARAIFDAVTDGAGDPALVVTGLSRGVAEHRVLLWSRHPDEQRRLAGTAVAGMLPHTGAHPQVGFYLNDATAGKADYYLDQQPMLSARACRPDGSQRLEASITLESTMPKDFGTLSQWITGTGAFTPRGTIAVNVRLYGPVAGRVTRVTVDGEPRSVTSDRHRDRQVAVVPVVLQPGQRLQVRATMTTGPGQTQGPVLSFTPGIRSRPNGVTLTSACG
jgi:hypothetical protein